MQGLLPYLIIPALCAVVAFSVLARRMAGLRGVIAGAVAGIVVGLGVIYVIFLIQVEGTVGFEAENIRARATDAIWVVLFIIGMVGWSRARSLRMKNQKTERGE